MTQSQWASRWMWDCLLVSDSFKAMKVFAALISAAGPLNAYFIASFPACSCSSLVITLTGEGKSTLKLSGSTDGAITLPSLPSVTFDPFKLDASLAFKPSVSLESFSLEGAGSVAGIGSFDASFTYEDGASALELELRPAFPKPFEENTTAIMLSYKDAQLQGTFKASIKLEGSEEPVEVESSMVFTSKGFSFDGKTVGTISVPSLDCLTFGEMSLDAELQVCPD